MRGTPFGAEGKGSIDAVAVARKEQDGFFWSSVGVGSKRKWGASLERRSVLDHRRSPSPPTSSSTRSSSLGGAADTAGVAAVSDPRWPPPPPSSSDSTTLSSAAAERREEWAPELRPIPPAFEIGDEWEALLGEPTACPGGEQTFLRWISGDIDDPAGLKQQQQLFQDLDAGSGALGFGLGDPGLVLEALGGATAPPGSAPAINSSPSSNLSGFASTAGNLVNNSGGGRGIACAQPSQSVASAPFSGIKVPIFGNNQAALSLPPEMFFQEPAEDKPPPPPPPQLFGPSVLLHHHQQQSFAPHNPTFFLPVPSHAAAQQEHGLLSQPKRHHAHSAAAMDSSCQLSGQDLFLRRNLPQAQRQQLDLPSLNAIAPYQLLHRPKPKAVGDEAAITAAAQQQALVDQLFKAAELVETGNSFGARGILARLNHQLPSSLGKPLLRSAFYFKEALNTLLHSSSSSPPPLRTTPLANPLDVMLKLSAYKAFSDVSPVVQFANFTCVQALLEELGASERIHILDFDIGVGGQWSSFMQELAQRRCTAVSPPFLKITAFVSTCSHHPLELHLTRENLSQFATELNIPFEFNVVPLDSFDPATLLAMSRAADESVAVNLPIGSALALPVPVLLRLVKQLNPKIVVSIDHGGDRSDLSFSHHFLHALQSSMVLLDSIDAAGILPDVAHQIEHFLLQPRIESVVLGRHRAGEKTPLWRTLFTSLGFVPLQFSNFAETQAECLVKRAQVRGFHVDKRQQSLVLYWQRGELASVSAWRC